MTDTVTQQDIDQLKAIKDVPSLINILNNYPDRIIRSRAADALGDIRNPSAIDPLIAALDTTVNVPGGNLSGRVARALSSLDATKAVLPICKAFQQENDPHAQYDLIYSLYGLLNSTVADPVMVDILINKLPELRQPQSIRGVIKVLGELGDRKAINTIQPFLNSNDIDTRVVASEALKAIESK